MLESDGFGIQSVPGFDCISGQYENGKNDQCQKFKNGTWIDLFVMCESLQINAISN